MYINSEYLHMHVRELEILVFKDQEVVQTQNLLVYSELGSYLIFNYSRKRESEYLNFCLK